MGAEVDSLEIAVQTTAGEASKSLDLLIRKLGLVAEGLSSITKNSGLSDFSKKVSEVSKNDGLDKAVSSTKSIKNASDTGEKVGKSFAESIIRGYKIKDKDVQSSIRDMAQQLGKIQLGEVVSGTQNDSYLEVYNKLGETVSKNANILRQRMGIYDDFYQYFQSLGKIQIPQNVVSELGDDWGALRRKSKKFSTDGSGAEIDSIYQEMSSKYKDMFSGTTDETRQFREIIQALENYRSDVNKLEPVDVKKVAGFEDGMWDDLFQGVNEMRHKLTESMSGLSKSVEESVGKTASEIREQYKDLGKDFTFDGNEKQIQSKIASLTNTLENAKLKQQELETGGNIDGKAYESTIASIVKYENQINSLKAQLESLREAERLEAEEREKEIARVIEAEQKRLEEEELARASKTYDRVIKTDGNAQVFDKKAIEDYINGTDKQMSDLEERITKRVEEIRTKFADIGTRFTFEGSEKQIENRLRSLENAYSNAQMKQQELETGGNIDGKAYESAVISAIKLENQIDILRAKLEALRATESQTAQQPIIAKNNQSEFQKVGSLIAGTVRDLTNGTLIKFAFSKMIGGVAGALKKIPAVAKVVFSKIPAIAKAGLSAMGSMTKLITKPLTSAFGKLSSAISKPHKSLFKGIGTIARYAIGVRSLFALVNKLKQAIVEGMQNVAKYSSETNSSISMLMNSTNQLKNSVAAAASPLLNALAPALNTIIQMCINAANAVNQLLSALTGHGTWIKATKQTKDYAAGLGSAGSAAEDLKTHTLGIDELNVVDQNSSSGSSGGGGGTSAGDMFETADIDSKFSTWADKIKEMWNKADFTELGAAVGRWLKNGLDAIPWDGIQEQARRIASSIGTFINGFVETEGLATSIGTTVGQALNTAVDFANTLLDVTHWDSIGKFIGDGLNGAVNAVQWDELGQMLAGFVNALFEIVGNASTTFEWSTFGENVANGINTAIETLEFSEIGESISAFCTGFLEMFISGIHAVKWGDFGAGCMDGILAVDWGGIAGDLVSIAEEICVAILDFCIAAIKEVNWQELGTSAYNELISIVQSVNWNALVTKGFELFGLAIGALGGLLVGICKGVWDSLVSGFESTKEYFNTYINEAGGNVILGMFNGIVAALAGIGTWIKEHIIDPFINGFKEGFGIHSPSTVMAELGGYIIEGLFNGISNGWNAFKDKVGEIAGKVIDKFKDVLGIHSPSTVMDENGVYLVEGLKNGITSTMDDVYNLFTKEKWEQIGQDMLSGLTAPFENGDGIGAIGEFANNVVSTISDTLSASTFGNIGKTAIDSLASSFTIDALRKIFTNIKTALTNVWSETTTWWSGTAMPTFFSTNVAPWFTSAKWKTATDGMKTGIIAKWDEFSTQWKSKIQSWWNTNVEPWFESSKWKDLGDNFKTSLLDKWNEFSDQWNSNISTWFESSVSTWFTKEKWQPFGVNMKDGLYEGFKGIVEQVRGLINGIISMMNSGMNNLTKSLNDLIDRYNDVADEVGGDSIGNIDYSDADLIDDRSFSVGGFPEDGLFFANHTEMVGRFSNGKTAVANNDQIVDGISAGVKSAVAEILAPYLSQIADNTRETANKNTSISLDGRELVSAINNRTRRNGFSFT